MSSYKLIEKTYICGWILLLAGILVKFAKEVYEAT